MFCSACGAKANGNFCSACGATLSEAEPIDTVLMIDWSNTIDYQTLLTIPEVRQRIAQSAAQSKRRMTGEEFLDLCDKLTGKMAVIPMATIAHFAQSLHTKLGVKTGKSQSRFIERPAGVVLVALLCSLARHGREVRHAQQSPDGCIITASLPSDLFALEGELIVAVARRPGGALVDANTDIKGQMFDWGKSRRCLEELFAELQSAAVAA
jgi:hypothetical protein